MNSDPARVGRPRDLRVSDARQVVLVTGSSGLVGSAAVDRLGHEFVIAGLDRRPPQETSCPDHFFLADLASEESLAQALAELRAQCGSRLASIIHLVAHVDLSGRPSAEYERVTVGGTASLLRELADFQVEQFIYASTILVHAPCRPGGRINEDWPLAPAWAYPRSKLEAEEVVRASCGQVPALVMRIGGVYSDRCRSPSLSHQIGRIFERRACSRLYPGDPSHGRARVHVDDVAAALHLAVARRAELPEETTLLVGERETLSYDELQRELGYLIHGEAWETKRISIWRARACAWLRGYAPGAEALVTPWMVGCVDHHYALDTARAERLLGWRPRHSLRETLPEMVRFLKEDPAAFYTENGLALPGWMGDVPLPHPNPIP
jgi:nucleoside-diphosphate-sugar epimerase